MNGFAPVQGLADAEAVDALVAASAELMGALGALGATIIEILSGPVGWTILAGSAIAAGVAITRAHHNSETKLENAAQDQPRTPCEESHESSKPSESPKIDADELTQKTREQIEQLAKEKGLKQDANKPNKYRDPVTGKERLRIDPGHIDQVTGKPFDNPNAARPHVHGYDEGGAKIRDPTTNDPHFPLVTPGG